MKETAIADLSAEALMVCNVGGFDRTLRFILGALILAAGFYFKSWWGLVGLIFLGTALVRFCPLYLPLKLSTDSKSTK